MFKSPLDRLKEADRLPPGHYARDAAQQRVNAEYNACHTQENALVKLIHRDFRFLGKEQACWLTWAVCDALGFQPPKMLYFGSSEVHEYAAAHYNADTRSIYFKYMPPVSIRTLLHELSHHIHHLDYTSDRSAHGSYFCWIEQLCFKVAADLVDAQGEPYCR